MLTFSRFRNLLSKNLQSCRHNTKNQPAAISIEERTCRVHTVFQFAFAALYAWVLGFATQTFPVQAFTQPEVVLPLAYLCVMATAVALLFQNVGQIYSDPSSAAVILSLESVFGVISSVLFYGDPVTGRLIAGFVLIFIAVICSETKFSFLYKATSSSKSPSSDGQ